MTGIDLLLTAICMNVMCNVSQVKSDNFNKNNGVQPNFYDSQMESSAVVKEAALKQLKKELKGKTLRVTTIQVREILKNRLEKIMRNLKFIGLPLELYRNNKWNPSWPRCSL